MTTLFILIVVGCVQTFGTYLGFRLVQYIDQRDPSESVTLPAPPRVPSEFNSGQWKVVP